MPNSELFIAVSNAADVYSDGMLQHALGEHLIVGEIVSLARIFLAGGYDGTAHGLIEASVIGDAENYVTVTEHTTEGISVLFRNYDDEEYWHVIYPETVDEFATRLDLISTGKHTYATSN